MRRNNNMANRGGIGGPLMTNHLQDLELELELLKRKRQLIQQQQNEILYRPAVDHTRYEQPRQMFEDRFDAPQRRNFSHLYDEAPRDAHPFAPKRRAVPVWDNAPGDRFDGPPVANKKPRQSPFPPIRLMDNPQPFQRPRAEPLPSLLGPKPLMSFGHGLAQRNQRGRPATQQTNFKRNTKPFGTRPTLTPKKPTPNRPIPNKPTPNKAPVSAAVAPNVKKDKEKLILLADSKPRSKVYGRLELALGIIVKQIKTAHNSQETLALFATPPLARVMKQCIRDRLRSLMMGKEVGTGQDVVAEYRKAFPPDTDVGILELGGVEQLKQDEKGELAIKLLEEGDPELYFKKNMTKLLEVKLSEMFKKVEKAYNEGNAPVTSEILENLPEVKKSPTEESLKSDGEEVKKNVYAKKHPKEEEYDKWMTLLVERKLPELLAKHKYELIKLFDLDQMFRRTKAAIILNTNNISVVNARSTNDYTKIPITESSKDDPILPRNLPYFAKVQASPAIPKRRLMQEFLNRFNPKTIKRHKKNFNLLFVGFASKEDYDNILKADQSKIGNATLTIVGNAPKQADPTPVIELNDENESDGALDQVLTPQLDSQINDLLTSIRKADEEAKASDATNGEADVETENENVETKAPEATDGNDSDVQEVSDAAEVVAVEDDEVVAMKNDEVAAEADEVAPLKTDEEKAKDAKAAPATPAKAKAPATPSTIRTRRASRLAQNN